MRCNMDSLELENLRAIKKSGQLHLNNLNLFLGANSTGKSTILRFFPLIRQTISRNSTSPILWYDSEGVDFGSFKESIYSENLTENISFKFGFDSLNIDNTSEPLMECLRIYIKNKSKQNFFFFNSFSSSNENNFLKNVAYKVSVNQDKYTKIEVFFNSKIIEFDLVKSKIKIDDKNVPLSEDTVLLVNNDLQHKIIPNLRFDNKRSKISFGFPLEKLIGDLLLSIAFKNINSQITMENLAKFLNNLKYFENIQEFEKHSLAGLTQKSIKTNVKENIELIYDYFTVFNCLCSIKQINSNLEHFFKNISYIAPVRATAERYYRKQGLSLLDVDSMGSNVPMILDSMSPKEKRSWKEWTSKNFDIEFESHSSAGHTFIEVKNSSGSKHNLADTGFGFSQILPVLLVVWKKIDFFNRINRLHARGSISNKTKNEQKSLIIIEQPELHLHPAMQAQLADLFIKIISNYPNIQFIIETHSVVIMNRIGQHIEKDNCKDLNTNLEEKINVFLVNPSDEFNNNVIFTSYDDEGIIKKWPVGFLSGGIL